MVNKIIKRDGRVVDFDKEKITNAIFKAAQAVGGKDRKIAEQLSDLVVKEIEEKFKEKTPSVEEVQDVVEKVLIEQGHAKTAKAYILYRQKRAEERKTKAAVIGKAVKTNLSLNALKVLKERYLLKDDEGNVIETPEEMFRRVANNIAQADKNYDINNIKETEEKFYNLMDNLDFLPNSPTLMNAGTDIQQLAACFVLPIQDSMEGIFTTLMHAAIIHKSGGGTGFSFSRLRPKSARVKSTQGVASGPVSFLTVYNSATDVIKQGGKRRGANMGILRVDHPDVLDFINCKEKNDAITNFNISVALTEDFMKAVEKNKDYDLIDPSTKRVVRRLNARTVFDMIVAAAWRNGDPGIVFIDKINEDNPTPGLGEIESTNPCIAGDSLVSTEYGLMRMDKLVENLSTKDLSIAIDMGVKQIYESGLLTEQRGIITGRVSKAWNSGLKDTFKLKTKSGFKLVATPNHKILTLNGWKELRELKIDDKVLIQSGEGQFNKKSELFENKYAEKWSKELGQILGWLIGDGWLREDKKDSRAGFSFGEGDRIIFEYLKPILNKLYKKEIKEVIRKNKVIHLSYHSKAFVEFFKKLGVKAVKARGKCVPKKLFTATREAVIGFLQGVFSADGTIAVGGRKNTNYIRLTAKSNKLLEGVQLLLLNLGIKSKIYERHRNRRLAFSYRNLRGELRLYESDGILYELQISKDMIPVFLEKIGFLCNKHNEKIKKLRKIGFYKTHFEDRVVSIEPSGKKVVYDLNEITTNSFIANGIVIHNCGEQPLLPYEACNLGSINLGHLVEGNKVDWERLRNVVYDCVHFLDNVIDMSKYPIEEITKMVKGNRKIGLGVMGWADMLVQLEIPYNSKEALQLAEKIISFIRKEADNASIELAKKRGVFPNWKDSIYNNKSKYFKGKNMKLRNATRLTIAPTGTIGMIADASGGIEPLFALSYVKRVMDGKEFFYVDENFKNTLSKNNIYSEDLLEKIINKGSIQNMEEIPEKIRKVFVVAHDITPEDHIRMQGAFQKYTDNAVSKTVNFPNSATVEDVKKVYLLAYKLGCKGVTIYRDRSKEGQVLNLAIDLKKRKKEVCPECNAKMVMSEGCAKCVKCGYSVCS